MRNKKKKAKHVEKLCYILQLPDHIIVEIFCKIPLKTLVKCRFVCKPWHRLFSNQQFTKDLFSQTPPYLLVTDANKVFGITRHFLVDWDNVSNPKDAFKISTDLNDSRKFVGVCNGLLCYYTEFNRGLIGFCISNPITGESVPLAFPNKEPSYSGLNYGTNFGFGYSPKSQVYKVVVLMGYIPKWMVLTVGCTSWRSFCYPNKLPRQENGIYVNGYLNWMSVEEGTMVIHSFNLESESFEQLPIPPLPACCFDPKRAQLNLGVSNGCLSVTARSSYYIRLWVMKEYGVKESWTMEVDIREILGGKVKPACEAPTRVLQYTKESQVLVLDGMLQIYSKKDRFMKYEVNGIQDVFDAAYIHIQSFVLLKDLLGGSRLYVQTLRHDKNPSMYDHIRARLGWSS